MTLLQEPQQVLGRCSEEGTADAGADSPVRDLLGGPGVEVDGSGTDD